MEANLTAQTNAASANVSPVRQQPAAKTPAAQSVSAAPAAASAVSATQYENVVSAASLADLVEDSNSSSIVNITISPTSIIPSTAEDLAINIPLPYHDRDVTDSIMSKYLDSVNGALAPSFFRLNVGVHEPTNRITVQVIDTKTNEILREIPPEGRLDILAKMQEFVGLLFDGQS